MPSIKNLTSPFVRQLWLTSAVVFLFILSFVMYVHAEKQIDRANEDRLRSFILADELRQSSDDLTRMVRTYIATGNTLYKQHYQEILDIRNGIKPRPSEYQNIYWDLIGLDDKRPSAETTKAISLMDMMQQAGFSDEEFTKLSEAKNNSDALTETEFAAMKLIETQTVSSAEKESLRNRAIELLHDEAYHHAKASIMRPIGDFYRLMNIRTTKAVQDTARKALYYRVLFVCMGLFVFIMLWRLHTTLKLILGGSLDDVHAQISRIGKGDFSHPITINSTSKESILEWLGETQTTLQTLITTNERLKNLYAALSQCNQAIIRSKNEAELFPIICRDAIDFGGMQMAWIGIADETAKELKVMSYYGKGSEYLDNLHISIDPENPSSHGPTGIAFHQNIPVWCQDFQHDPATSLWHERGKQFGWGSSAALPLSRGNKVVGVFTLYAKESNVFDEAVQHLLEEMVMDISYALDSFDHEIARQKAENELEKSQKHLSAIIENEPECVKLVDLNGRLLEMNPAGLAMLEAESLEEVQQYTLMDYILPEWRASFIALHKKVLSGENALLEFEIQGLKGTRRWLETHATPLRDSEGNVTMILGITRDTTQRKSNEEQISYLANYDSLTGLPNRTLLAIRIKELLSIAKRNNQPISVMFLDLDRFKDINDSLGHTIGDSLLIESAERLKTILREEDTVARLGGDEFIILLPNTNSDGAMHVAHKLLETFKKPFHIDNNELTISTSIGISLYPNDGTDFEVLYKNADTAMYRAKHNGRNNFCFFTEDMQQQTTRILELGNALHHALERNELYLHYQPQFSVHDQSVIGAEVLLRWNHPELGNVSPAEFIPIAEENGMILPIGEWVLRKATAMAKEWMDQGYPPIILAINLSAVQFRSDNLPSLVSSILEEVGLPPEYLELELTESIAMHDPQRAISMMNELHQQGIRISIDDFGTGYSSLSYLKKFNIYKLKIDQSFVRDIDIDPEDKAIVSAIINMSKSLGLLTIAEGVETIGQLSYLQEQGCDEIQGYYFSKPLPQEAFEAFRRNH